MSRHFGGETFHPDDQVRLEHQYDCVWWVMSDGEWHTLEDIERECRLIGYYDSQPGISARLRDFRKAANGSHEVERDRMPHGQWRYRLIENRGE